VLICGILVVFFFSRSYIEKKQNLELEANKLEMSALKQTEQLIPGILVKEEYGSIEMQLQKITKDELLINAQFIPAAKDTPTPGISCGILNQHSKACYDIMEGLVTLTTAINISGETLGYLVKTKKLETNTNSSFSFLTLLILAITVIFIYLLVSILVFVDKNVRKPLLNLHETISPILDGKTPTNFQTNFVEEIQSVSIQVQEIIKKYEERKAASVLIDVSMQVSHDLRSPLSALNSLLGQLSQIPEAQRVMMRSAIQRMNDIANQLLQKGKEVQSKRTNHSTEIESVKKISLSTHLLSPLIDGIVSEKRVQFREKQSVEIEADINQSYGLFANINATELKRTISNLVNNAIEAFPNESGKVTVSVKKNMDEQVAIIIQDNGKGIPEHILKKLGEIGVSHGKEGTQSGSGLGVYHAKKTVEDSGGKFKIQSSEGVGTTITMAFNKASAPKWFVEKLVLIPNMIITSLDDDISIHQIWKGRLESKKVSEFGIKHTTFTSGLDFKTWVTSQPYDTESARLYLVDYELLNQNATGLDIIEELGLSNQSILVTSRYEEDKIRERCERLSIRLIPKTMAGFVPIEIAQPKELVDCILLDDDFLVHSCWKMAAEMRNIKFIGFQNVDEFFARADALDVSSPLFVDSNLGNGIKGEDISRRAFELGFKNVYLCTGYEPDSFPPMPWLKGIKGKDPAFFN
jgi:signal transduction histidine kinase